MEIDELGSPIQQQRLHEEVTSRIRKLILNESLHPGDRLLSERLLAEHLGVSRIVIREALKVLNAQGLVEIKQGSGTYVTGLSGNHVTDAISFYLLSRKSPTFYIHVLEIRRPLEIEIAALAAERATSEDIDGLEKTLSQMTANVGEPASFAEYDLAFHEQLAVATHNELFPVMLGPLSTLLLEFRVLAHEYDTQGATEGGLAYHRLILDKVKAQDVAGARQAMVEHMEQAKILFEAATTRMIAAEDATSGH